MRHSIWYIRLPFLLLCFAAALNTKTIFAYEKLVLAVPVFPPYTYLDQQQQLTGSGTTKVKQLLGSMGLEYQFRVVANHGVAANLMEKGLIDGFFLATQNEARDQLGVMSSAVMYNNWAWFYMHDSPLLPVSPHFRTQAKIGTRLNTNTYQWLLDNDYLIAAKTSDASTLIVMLTNRRLDAVFLSAAVFWHALTEAGIERSLVHHTTQSSQPFSCYFSKAYLARNPGFLEQFNHLAETTKD